MFDKMTVLAIYPHGNADNLCIIDVDGSGVTYTVARKGQFEVGQSVLFFDCIHEVEVDTSKEWFEFLKPRASTNGYYKVKRQKLRGVVSQGFLMDYLEKYDDFSSKEELAEFLGVRKIEPNGFKPRGSGGSILVGQTSTGPDHLLPTMRYDVETLSKCWWQFKGRTVTLREKVHGANMAVVFHDGELHVRSRNLWKKEGSTWNAVAEQYKMEEKLRPYEGYVLYGEVFGKVQDLSYGREGIDFVAFDLYVKGKGFVPEEELEEFCKKIGIPVAPSLGSYTFPTGDVKIPEDFVQMLERDSIVSTRAGDIMEGIVVTAIDEQTGKPVKAKLVSERYKCR